MLNSKERKQERLNSGLPDVLSPGVYNAVMFTTLLYGFVVNALMVTFIGDALAGVSPIALIIGYFISCLAGSLLAASKKPAVSFLGYNLIVLPIGVLLCTLLPGYGAALVMEAIVITAIVTVVMLVLGVLFPQIFSGMGRALGICLLVGCLLSLASWFIAGLGSILVYAFVIIFTLYVGYDMHRAQSYPRTLDNAIDSAIDLYMDVINLFLRILSILAELRSDD